MPALTDDMRARALQQAKDLTAACGARIVSAFISPQTTSQWETADPNADFQIRVGMVPAAPGARVTPMLIQRMDNSVLLFAADLDYGLRMSARGGTEALANAFASPYIDAVASDALIRSPAMAAMAPRAADLGPSFRAAIISAAQKTCIDLAAGVRDGTVTMNTPLEEGAPADEGAGFAAAIDDRAEDPRLDHYLGRGLAGLKMAACLMAGNLPPHEELDWTPQVAQALTAAGVDPHSRSWETFEAARQILVPEITAYCTTNPPHAPVDASALIHEFVAAISAPAVNQVPQAAVQDMRAP